MTEYLRKLRRTRSSPPATPAAGNELLTHDRRASKRHFDPLPATLRYGVGGGEQRVGICNFSDQGLCFRGEVRFPVGATVEVTATLPRDLGFGGRTVRYLARVIRVSLQRGEFITASSIYGCQTVAGPASHESKPLGSSRACQSRRFSRYRCSSRVQFRATGGARILSGQLRNLSLAGCYVQTAEPCPPGATVEVVLQSGKTRIYAQGRVKAVQQNQGMAVEFLGELAERLQRLPRFVQVVSSGAHQ